MSQTDNHGTHEVHACPMWILIGVCLALMFLTYITVAATYIDLGQDMNLVLAMAIATVKATLVVLFFMHLFWDKPFNWIVFVGSLIFVALFLCIAMMDSIEYQPQIIPGYAPEIEQTQ